jgi:hypothetical protein
MKPTNAQRDSRCGTAPTKTLALRKAPVFRNAAHGRPVLKFIERQEYLGNVFDWVQTRAVEYQAAFKLPEDGVHARAEAAIDLIAWQRRVPELAKSIAVIGEHEAYCESVKI